MSFAKLREKTRQSVAVMQSAIENANSGSYKKDERYWTMTTDKAGNGSAIIRFLPAPEGEEVPFVRLYEYSIKIGQKWYIEKCRSTIGEKDPMNEYFFEVRGDNPTEERKAKARKFARKQRFISNILVIDDPANPENNGKVFLFKYGKSLFDKIEGAIKPPFDDETPFNPFDMWEGADFKLRVMEVDGFPNYKHSGFAGISALSDDDSKLEKIWNQCYSLQAEIAPDKFKSYDELKEKIDRLLHGRSGGVSESADTGDDDEGVSFSKAKSLTESVENQKHNTRRSENSSNSDDDEDDFARYRKMLADSQ